MTQPSAYGSESLPFDDRKATREADRKARRKAEYDAIQQQIQAELFAQRPKASAALTDDEMKAVVDSKRAQLGLKGPQKPLKMDKVRHEAARRSRTTTHESRRRRALGSMRALPYRLSTDVYLTDACFSVLELHYRMADDGGTWSASLPEITNRLKLSRSTVIRAHKLLEDQGLLEIERDRVMYDRNKINVYRLGPDLMKGRPRSSTSSGVGVRHETPKGESITSLSSTPDEDQTVPEAEAVPEADAPRHERSVSAGGGPRSIRSPKREPGREASTIRPTNETGLRLARAANRLIDPDEPKEPSVDYLLERCEQLRREHVPLIFPKLWELGRRRHGWNAILAVFETVLLTKTGWVHSPHGYLWGTLRKECHEANPHVTLSRFMTARRARSTVSRGELAALMTPIYCEPRLCRAVRYLHTYFGHSPCEKSEIMIHISDMKRTVSDLKAAILARIESGAAKGVWTPRDFLDLGARDAVDKTLQRLTRAGNLRRVDRGLYDMPSFNSLTQKSNPPDPRQVIEAIARRDRIRVLVDGMTAANDLGLTNAVPAKIVVHTDARLKPVKLEQLVITFKPTAPSKLYWAGRPAMRIVQALHWLRDTMGQVDDDAILIHRLHTILHDSKDGRVLRTDLSAGMSALPTWMQNMLRPMLKEQTAT